MPVSATTRFIAPIGSPVLGARPAPFPSPPRIQSDFGSPILDILVSFNMSNMNGPCRGSLNVVFFPPWNPLIRREKGKKRSAAKGGRAQARPWQLGQRNSRAEPRGMSEFEGSQAVVHAHVYSRSEWWPMPSTSTPATFVW